MSELYVGKKSDFAELGRKVLAHGDLEIGVFLLNGGEFVAYENNCVHQGGPVCQGKIINRVVEVLGADQSSQGLEFSPEDVHIVCPWHGWEFNLKTGRHPGEPRAKLRAYKVLVRNGEVFVVV